VRIQVIEISWGCGALLLLKKKFGGPARTGHFQCPRKIKEKISVKPENNDIF